MFILQKLSVNLVNIFSDEWNASICFSIFQYVQYLRSKVEYKTDHDIQQLLLLRKFYCAYIFVYRSRSTSFKLNTIPRKLIQTLSGTFVLSRKTEEKSGSRSCSEGVTRFS